eukprot:1529645-Pyramimonas_sp.AAC.1
MAIQKAKQEVVGQLKANAASFAGQLKTHLENAKAKAAEQRTVITQAAKKRKSDGGAKVELQQPDQELKEEIKEEVTDVDDIDEILKAARAARADATS